VVRRVVRRRRAAAPAEDPKLVAKKRADELVASGMPFQMAMAVAHGRITLNEALERMARLDRVNKMMEQHELSRALATQISLGHASLDQVLAKRRLAAHRTEFRDRSCLTDAVNAGTPAVLALQNRRITALVQSVQPYTFTVLEDGKDQPEEIHKLQLKYSYQPDDWKKVRKGLKKDKAVSAAAQAPSERPQDRYTCSDKRLFRYMDKAKPVTVTTLEGDVVKGTITWFGRYEFGMDVGGAPLVVLRHALQDLSLS